MKSIIVLVSLLLSSVSFAQDCKDLVFEKFLAETEEYDYHTISDKFETYQAGTEGFESYGQYVELGYDFDVISYHASNEYMSGYGAYEIIVEPKTCEVLKIENVYAE
jgi:hypothetical protein